MPDLDGSPSVVETFTHAFSYCKNGSAPLNAEEAESEVGEEAVNIKLQGRHIQILYRDIVSALAEDYRVEVTLRDGSKAEFYYLGHSFDSFAESFFGRYNTLTKKDSFMGEEAVCVKRGARFEHTGSQNEQGECDLYLGKHALIIQRVYSAPARLPYALIDAVEYRQYDISVDICGERWNMSMLGHEYEGFQTQYEKRYAELLAETCGWLQEIKSGLAKAAANQAAVLYLDGRPVAQSVSDKVAVGLWEAVFNKACEYGGEEYFGYLYKNASAAWIGFKNSLYDECGSYIWLMAHISGHIVFEAASSVQTGMATYVFKVKDSPEDTMKLLNYCMHMTEFRREPVYLSDAELNKPENAGYLNAVQRVPQIKVLRGLYQGRLIHTQPEKWARTLEKIIE